MPRREKQARQRRRKLILEGVDAQLSSPKSPEVRAHYDRLRALGHSKDQAKELIAAVLVTYIWHALRQDRYTYSDYVGQLARLPEIDGQEDE